MGRIKGADAFEAPYQKHPTMKWNITALMILLAGTTQAQKWHYGLKADLNLSGINGNGMKGTLVTGVQGGGFAEYRFNKKWELQPELLFTQSNYTKSDDFSVYYNNDGRLYANGSVDLSYITVPVLLRYNLNPILSLLAGPQYSFLVYDNEDLRADGAKAFRNYELAADIGGQVNLSLFSLYVRYSQGLNDINDIDTRYKWTSHHFQAGVAVRLN